jgi:hypothetical protein
MNITPLTANVSVPVPPVQDTSVDQAKVQKLAEAQTATKQSVVYFSPVIKIDRSTSTAIFQYRDRSTGEVTREFPTSSEIKAYESKGTSSSSPSSEQPPAEDDVEHAKVEHVKEDA